MKSNIAKLNLMAVSAYQRETGINVFQTLDLTLLTALSDIINLEPRRENNKDEATGKEEPDMIYDLGDTAAFTFNFEKAQPQHYAFLLAYGLGVVASSAAGSGYLKTITPIIGDFESARDLPGFTAAMAYSQIVRKRFASFFVNGVTATFAKDSWCKLAGEIVGTGKHEESITEEIVAAAENVTSLTLDANGVAGATAAERLDAIHQTRVELASGVWTEVAFSAVSSATPAVITITAPGVGTDVRNFKILYAPTAAAWMTFPARVTETPLRVSELEFNMGGAWNGTTFGGGRDLGPEIKSIEYKLSNSGKVEFVPGAGGAFASRYVREDRDQVLSLDLEFRNYILQNLMNTNEYFGARVLAEGAEYETGHNYSVEMIFPKLGILKAPLSVDGRRLGEKGDLQVLQHDTYGSVIIRIKNLAQYYAA
jgi:hypothetical protein